MSSVQRKRIEFFSILEWLKQIFSEFLNFRGYLFRHQVNCPKKSLAAEHILSNDIFGRELDPEMPYPMIGKKNNLYIAMHMRGNPKNYAAKRKIIGMSWWK